MGRADALLSQDIDRRWFYQLGRAAGYREGHADGYAEYDDWFQKVMGVYREAVNRTPARVADSVAPCPAKCGACSTCTRSKAAWARKRNTGSFDFAGGAVPAW